MKKIMFCLFFSFSCLFMFAQKENKEFAFVDKMPEYPGGVDSLIAYLGRETKYPKNSKDKEGTAFVEFIVSDDGSIKNPKIVRSNLGKEFEDECLRVVNSMPKWIPGKIGDKNVSVRYTIPMRFKLY